MVVVVVVVVGLFRSAVCLVYLYISTLPVRASIGNFLLAPYLRTYVVAEGHIIQERHEPTYVRPRISELTINRT